MGVYVIREGLAEADELLPSWGLGTGQVWCMATLTCLCLQEWDGTSASNEGYPKVRNHREGPYCLSLMTFALRTHFHVERPWG